MKLHLLQRGLLLVAAFSSLLGTSFAAPCTHTTGDPGVHLKVCPENGPSYISEQLALEVARRADEQQRRDAKLESELSFFANSILPGADETSGALRPRAVGSRQPAPPPPPPPPPFPPKTESSNTGPGIRLKLNEPPSRNPSPERAKLNSEKGFEKNPAKPEPGSGGTHDTTPVRPIAEIEAAGRNQLQAYRAALRTHTQDTKIVQDKSLLPAGAGGAKTAFLDVRSVKGYQIKTKSISNPTTGSLKSIRLFSKDDIDDMIIKNTDTAEEIQISPSAAGKSGPNDSKDKTPAGPADSSKSIVKMTIDSKGRYFIMQDSFKATDKTGSGIPLNEMVMQNFLHTAGPNANKFQVMFIVNVQNQEFWNVVRANYDEAKRTFNQVYTFEANTPAFNRLMGTQNINSKLFGFQNHYIALGRKEPKKIVVIPQQVPNADELSVALVFGKTEAK